MKDSLSKAERSARMAKIKSQGAESTEGAVESVLRSRGIRGWYKHPHHVIGRPDFYFPRLKLALFVDGCFWHGCPKCSRRIPRTRTHFWAEKLEMNRKRDLRVRRALGRAGISTMRIWEHDIGKKLWVKRLTLRINTINANRYKRRSNGYRSKDGTHKSRERSAT